MSTKTLKQLASKVRIESTYGASLPYNEQDEWQRKSNGWRCTLKYKGKRYSFDFWQGSAITHDPTAEGVLDCLLSDASGAQQDFEGFCSEFGYDTDSRKAERIYKACQKTEKALKRLLGEEYDDFMYSER